MASENQTTVIEHKKNIHVCILGDRGVGKSTFYRNHRQTSSKKYITYFYNDVCYNYMLHDTISPENIKRCTHFIIMYTKNKSTQNNARLFWARLVRMMVKKPKIVYLEYHQHQILDIYDLFNSDEIRIKEQKKSLFDFFK